MAKLTPDQIARLRRRFGPAPGGGAATPSGGGLESAAPRAAPDTIAGRMNLSRHFLRQFIHDEMGDDPALQELADRVLVAAQDGLEVIDGQRDSSEQDLVQIEIGLEVIVQTDGSRPAYLIREDDIVFGSGPPGVWTDLLGDVTRLEGIRAVLGSVGRIDVVHPRAPFAGTGWLVSDDVMVTNRHVAQVFVNFDTGGAPQIMPGREAHIDFGHEWQGTASRNRRRITEMLFCGATEIPTFGIDHGLLDLAAFRLAAPDAPGPAQTALPIGIGDHLAAAPTRIMVIGYPAEPPETVLGSVSETDKVLFLLFSRLWGYKRLAPGRIMPGTLGARTLSHDATTLGGNSGSLVMGLDTVPVVTGLHYGGQWGADRVNWGHVLRSVLDEPGVPGLRHATLRDLCAGEGVGLVGPG